MKNQSKNLIFDTGIGYDAVDDFLLNPVILWNQKYNIQALQMRYEDPISRNCLTAVVVILSDAIFLKSCRMRF